jgi:hypothetical protein
MQFHRIGRSSISTALILTAILLVAPASTARAEPVTVGILAILEYIDDMFCQCIREEDFAVGDTLLAFYTYDTAAVDTEPDPHRGVYRYTDPANGFRVYHRNFTFSSSPDTVRLTVVIDDSLHIGSVLDSYSVSSTRNLPDPVYAGTIAGIYVRLTDTTLSAISGDALPADPPVLADFSKAYLSVSGDGFIWAIHCEIISITTGPPTAVEPVRPAPPILDIAPNPFAGQVTIRYLLAGIRGATLSVYDVKGRHVRTLDVIPSPDTAAEFQWDGRDDRGREVPSGFYFVRLRGGEVTATRKVLLVR